MKTATKKAASKKIAKAETVETVTVAFRIAPELARRLKIAAAYEDMTQLEIVSAALNKHLAELEKKQGR